MTGRCGIIPAEICSPRDVMAAEELMHVGYLMGRVCTLHWDFSSSQGGREEFDSLRGKLKGEMDDLSKRPGRVESAVSRMLQAQTDKLCMEYQSIRSTLESHRQEEGAFVEVESPSEGSEESAASEAVSYGKKTPPKGGFCCLAVVEEFPLQLVSLSIQLGTLYQNRKDEDRETLLGGAHEEINRIAAQIAHETDPRYQELAFRQFRVLEEEFDTVVQELRARGMPLSFVSELVELPTGSQRRLSAEERFRMLPLGPVLSCLQQAIDTETPLTKEEEKLVWNGIPVLSKRPGSQQWIDEKLGLSEEQRFSDLPRFKDVLISWLCFDFHSWAVARLRETQRDPKEVYAHVGALHAPEGVDKSAWAKGNIVYHLDTAIEFVSATLRENELDKLLFSLQEAAPRKDVDECYNLLERVPSQKRRMLYGRISELSRHLDEPFWGQNNWFRDFNVLQQAVASLRNPQARSSSSS